MKGFKTFSSFAELNLALAHWEKTVADLRIHGTTKRQVAQLFAEEKPALQPLPASVFACFQEGPRTVHRDGHVEVEKAFYHVPPEYLRQDVWVRFDSREVRIFTKNTNGSLRLGRVLQTNTTPTTDMKSNPFSASPKACLGLGFLIALTTASMLSVSSANGAQDLLRTWSRISGIPSTDTLVDITYGNGALVAVGHRGDILSSTNGIQWNVTHYFQLDRYRLDAVTFGDGRFVAVGRSLAERFAPILLSTNGVDWSLAAGRSTSPVYGATFGDGKFVIVGNAGLARVSTNGSNWVNSLNRPSVDLVSVAYGGGQFVALGEQNRTYRSTDGVIWQQGQSLLSNPRKVAFGRGRFVAVAASGRIFTSADGVRWTGIQTSTSRDLYSIGYGARTFVAVG